MSDSARHRAGRRTAPRTGISRRRLIGLLMMGGGLLVLAGFAWIAVTALMARSELNSARSEIATLRRELAAGDVTAATKTAAQLSTHAGRAHDLTTGPAWALAARLPAGGSAIRSVRGLTDVVDELAHQAVPGLIGARQALDPATIRGSDGVVDLTRLSRVAPVLHRAAVRLDAAVRRVDALPPDTWSAPVDAARRDVLHELRSADATIRSADTATQVLPSMLGDAGVRRYFVSFQNDAEARGTGGLPGAFGILAVDHGRLHFERFESDNYLDGVDSGLHLGADFDQLYGPARSTSLYVNSNLSPNFPSAARIWTAMWQRKTGQRLDGALALDPSTLSYLLAATGSTTLPDGTVLSAGTVVALTQSTVYRTFDGRTAQRRAYLQLIARRASAVILDSRGSTRSLVDAARRSVDERRLLAWSAHPSIERVLAGTDVGGVVPRTARPYAGLSVVNDGGDKLDYYLERHVTYERSGCGATRAVRVTITLTNTAPAGLPRSVTDRSDVHRYPIRPGDNRLLVSWFATSGAQLRGATLAGRSIGATVGSEQGHPVYSMDVELPRGASRTLVLELREPGTGAATGTPIVARQPLVRPLVVQVQAPACG